MPAGLAEALHPELLEDLQAGVPGPRDARALLPAGRRRHADGSWSCSSIASAAGCRRTIGPTFHYDPELVAGIASRCTEVASGARNVDHILTRTLLPEMSAEFLARMADGQADFRRSASRWRPTGSSSTSLPDEWFARETSQPPATIERACVLPPCRWNP